MSTFDKKYILALDQGTTSSRAMVVDHDSEIVSVAQHEFPQSFPQPGWVEHNPDDIWNSQLRAISEAIADAGIEIASIAAIGITNQRETTLIWERSTGIPIYPAIVWQDRRTSQICSRLKEQGHTASIRLKTGLPIDPYFSATKIQWILDHVDGARAKAEYGELAFGTVDTFLLWKLTDGAVHATDVSNASRTMLYNIHTLNWDDEILELLKIPRTILPDVRGSSEFYSYTPPNLFPVQIPITGIAGDQQAALFGQMCTSTGMVKNTYGTGAFMMMNTGKEAVLSSNNLLTTIAWKIGEDITYALEGSVFIAGAVVQWLRDGLGIIRTAGEVETLARSVPDNGDVYLVPAFTGLGAPHWDQDARGTIIGITRGTSAGHIARAALESIAFQVNDLLQAMKADSGLDLNSLRVDGGAAVNDMLVQFQADISSLSLVRPKIRETTTLGAAYLAGLAVEFWKDTEEIQGLWQLDHEFQPAMSPDLAKDLIGKWDKAVSRSLKWV